jgi:hypothetical protein
MFVFKKNWILVDILARNYNGQTAYNLLKCFLDLSTPPSKGFLRALAETATDAEDKKLLLFLVSQQGNFSHFHNFYVNHWLKTFLYE